MIFRPVRGLVRADGPDLDVSGGLAVDVKNKRLSRIASFNHVDNVAKFGFGIAPPFSYMRGVQPALEKRIMLLLHGFECDLEFSHFHLFFMVPQAARDRELPREESGEQGGAVAATQPTAPARCRQRSGQRTPDFQTQHLTR